MKNQHTFIRAIIDRTNHPVLYVEKSNLLVRYANPAAMRWLSVEPTSLIGKTLEQAEINDDIKKPFVDLQTQLSTANTGTELSITFTRSLINERATVHSVSTEPAPQQDDPGGFWFLVENDKIDQVIDNIIVENLMKNCDDMIYFKDLDSRFLRCSDSLAKLLGAKSRTEVCGKSDFDFFDESSATSFFECEQDIISTGEPWICKPEKTGESIWMLSSKMPLRDKTGKIVGTFGISKDITAQKEFEAELEQTNKRLNVASRHAGMAEIAMNVIHNVGNVLNSVNVSVSQVQEINKRLNIDNLCKVANLISENIDVDNFLKDDEKGKRIPEYLSAIAEELVRDREDIQTELEATRRNLDHIKTIVAMQQQYATSSSVIEETDLSLLLSDAAQISSSSMARHNIELVKQFDDEIIVPIDQHQVLQILINLIRNAKHACQDSDQPNKRIVLAVELTEDEIKIVVMDNGIGIEPDDLQKLFSHGFTTKKNGHGFGLHSGANSAKQMGGDLQGYSDGIGTGASFVLTLPRSRPPVGLTPAPVSNTQPVNVGTPSNT